MFTMDAALLLLSLITTSLSQEMTVKESTGCFALSSTIADVEFQSIQVDDGFRFTRTYFKTSCFEPSVSRIVNASSIANCAANVYLLKLNSFSYDGEVCTGYSTWAVPSSLFICSSPDHSTLLYLGDYQLTDYEENQGSDAELWIDNVTWTGFAAALFGSEGEISFNIFGPLCVIDSVDVYYGGSLYKTLNVTGSQMNFSTDNNLCSVQTAYFGINVNGEIPEAGRYDLKTQEDSNKSVTFRSIGFSDFDAPGEPHSTYHFAVDGDYEKVDRLVIATLYNKSIPVSRNYLTGGRPNFTFEFYPPDGICTRTSWDRSVTHGILLLDLYKCPLFESPSFLRSVCPTDNDKYTDYCSFCFLDEGLTLPFSDAVTQCRNNTPAMDLMPKIDTQQHLRALNNTACTDDCDAWVQYTLQSGTWQWMDGTTSVDSDLLNMDEFNSQPDSVGSCAVVKQSDSQFSLVKADCGGSNYVYCLSPPSEDVEE